ncbi:MAG: aminotransferase class V-fold PLP-dependent enzyme [Candidatus Tectomicrobia bacterium]|nr:aminotransferase class V-fold PLP-dependent enzyme [Candidatus Tectomicrobia bacterium]
MRMNDTDRHAYALADQPRIGLDIEGIRCAMPLMRTLSMNGACRASIYVYNTTDEIDILADSLREVRRMLRR